MTSGVGAAAASADVMTSGVGAAAASADMMTSGFRTRELEARQRAQHEPEVPSVTQSPERNPEVLHVTQRS
eukprot:5744925-Prymnesium_polylepis.1